MNPDVKAKAEALAKALAESEEFKALQEAQEELEKHEAAKIMLRDLRQKQFAVQQKIVAGENPDESEMQQLQETYQLVAFNPYVRRVIEAEVAFAAMLAEVQRILGEAGGAWPAEEGEEGQLGAGGSGLASGGTGLSAGGSSLSGNRPGDGGSARSRLWVPGRGL